VIEPEILRVLLASCVSVFVYPVQSRLRPTEDAEIVHCPELASRITASDAVGAALSVKPPEVADQEAAVVQSPPAAIRYRVATYIFSDI